MNRHQFKMNFAVKSKARSFATMGTGFVDEMETLKMEERLQLMKKTMEMEREERKNRGGQFWKSGQKGKLTSYANTILQSKISNKKIGKVKMLTDEQINLPNRNEASSLSKKLSDISNNSTGTFKRSTKSNGRLCGQCESNEAALCCIQCTEVYCTACFSAYHKKGALRKHRSISLEVSSTPRVKPSASLDTRLFDLPFVPTTTTTKTNCQQNGSLSPSGAASGASKKDKEEMSIRLSFMDDGYNEAESAASFQEALIAWRTDNYQTSKASGAASVATATLLDDSTQSPSSWDKPKKNEGIYTTSSTSTAEGTGSLASVMGNSQAHTLSYAEQLLVKRNRRTPISWESDTLDSIDPFENKENSEEVITLEMEESPRVWDPTEIPDRLNVDEPVTFSSLYHLVAEDPEYSNKFNSYEQEILPVSLKNVQNELVKSHKVSKSPNETFPQRSISVVPLVESFPEKSPSSWAASESDEMGRAKSEASHQTGKKTPTSQARTPKNQRPKSRTSSRLARPSNLTTTPSEGLQMVSHLVKSQHGQNDEQQQSFLMAGLSNGATGDKDGVSPRERPSLLKSNNGVPRPGTTVKVSYTLYKMSPCSWHPEQSISQHLPDNQFHPSCLLSESSRPGEKDNTQGDSTSTEDTQCVLPAFNSSSNTIESVSSDDEESLMMVSTEAVGNLPAMQSLHNQSVERRDSPLELSETTQVLACLNNNAISQREEKYEPVSPNNLNEEQLDRSSQMSIHSVVSCFRNETASPLQTDSTTPVRFVSNTYRSKTMPPIGTIDSTNEDQSGSVIYSARSLQRNKSLSPDFMLETLKDIFSTPIHSVKYSPRSKTVSPVPSEENDNSVRSSTCSASVHSVKDMQKNEIESRIIPNKTDATDHFPDIPILSATNTPRVRRKSLIPTLIKKQENRSILLNHSTKSTPKSNTISTVYAHQDDDLQVKHATPVYSFKGPPRSKSASPIPASLKPRVKSLDALTSKLSKIDTEENVSDIPVYLSKNPQRIKSASPMYDMWKGFGETPVESVTSSISFKTETSIATIIENGSSLSILSIEGTPENKTDLPIPTIDDTQECLLDTLVLTVKSTPVSPVPTITDIQESTSDTYIYSERNIPISPVPTMIDCQEAISDTPLPSLRSPLISPVDTQESNYDIPVVSNKSTPLSPIPTTIGTQENIRDTPIISMKYPPISPVPTMTDIQESISDTPVHSMDITPMSSVATVLDNKESISDTPVYFMENMPMSPVSTVLDNEESISDTPIHFMDNTSMSSVPTVLDNQENISYTPILSMKSTPMSSVPTIFDIKENISDSPVTFVKSTPISPVSTIIDTQESISTSHVTSVRDTPKTHKSETITISPPMSNRQDKETLQSNALIYQMMVNQELSSFSPDSADDVVPLLPTAADQTENSINFEQSNSPPSSGIVPTSMETNTTSNMCTATLPPTSVPLTSYSSGVDPSADSEETRAIHDKLATTFYMCNSDLYYADESVQSLGSTPMHHAGAKLKRGPTSTKKYIVRRQPKHPDETKPHNTSSPRGDDLQFNSALTSTSSSLEMKRINFKQSNQDKNVVSIEEMKSDSEQSFLVPDLGRLSPCQSEKLGTDLGKDDHESVFSSVTKMSVDSLEEEEESQNLMFNEDDFLTRDDFQTEIDEMENQIAEEMKVKALK